MELQEHVPTRLPSLHQLARSTPRELATLLVARHREGAGSSASSTPIAIEAPTGFVPSRARRLATWQRGSNPFAEQLSVAFRIEGPDALARLDEALHTLIARHPALRTGYRLIAGELESFLDESTTPRIRRCGDTGSLETTLAAQHRQHIPLDQPPLWIATTRDASDEGVTVQLTIHHLVVDAASVLVLADELFALLAGTELDAVVEVDTLRIFREPERWAAQEQDRRMSWYRRRFEGRPPPEPRRRWDYRWASYSLPQDAPRDPWILAAAFARAWGTARSEDRPIIGMQYSGRGDPGLRRHVGYLVDVLPIEVSIGGDLDAVAAQVARAFEDAVDHELPIDHVVASLYPGSYDSPCCRWRLRSTCCPRASSLRCGRRAGRRVPSGCARSPPSRQT